MKKTISLLNSWGGEAAFCKSNLAEQMVCSELFETNRKKMDDSRRGRVQTTKEPALLFTRNIFMYPV